MLKKSREDRKLTQREVADYINVSRPTYISIEKGVRELSVSELTKICDLFEMTVEEFIRGNKNTNYKVSIKRKRKFNKRYQEDIRIVMSEVDASKFKEVFLYVLEKVGSKPNVGKTVLYKLLYFIDFDFYEKYEEQLTGATYIKNHHGPTPIQFAEILDEMIQKNEIEKVKSKFFRYTQKKYLPHRSPDLSVLTARELNHIDGVLIHLSDKTAKELSEYSHEDVPWEIHEYGEIINYESVFYRDVKYSVKNYDDEI